MAAAARTTETTADKPSIHATMRKPTTQVERSQHPSVTASKKPPAKPKTTPTPRKRRRRSDSDLDLKDPLEVALSKSVREYLATVGITTAAQLLLARTTDVAQPLPQWRHQQNLAPAKAPQALVSVWKRKVRLRAAQVGATKLAGVNVGTNAKPVVGTTNDGAATTTKPST